MTEKVSELTGTDLDFWVAKSNGLKPYSDEPINSVFAPSCGLPRIPTFNETKERRSNGEFFIRGYGNSPFVADWNFVGKIIEQKEIEYSWRLDKNRKKYYWAGIINNDTTKPDEYTGYSISYLSILEAIKRCIVKIKYGDEVNND